MSERDWSLIEQDYRAGVLPLATVSRVHGVTRSDLLQHAEKNGWTRDLISQVRQEINERLTGAADTSEADEDAVARAARVAVEIVRSHRKDLSRLRGVAEGAIARLGELIEDGLVLGDGDDKAFNPAAVLLGKTQGAASALDQIASAYSRIIEMERQAFGLDALTPSVSAGAAVKTPNGQAAANVTFYLPSNHRDPTPE